MMNVKGYKRKGVLVFDSHIPIIWLLVVGGGYCLFPGVIDMPEKCKFTNLLCNESRLLKEDKIIILNIGNELRNRVAGGTFKYLNLQHDPVSDMNKLYWNEEIARKATMIVSSCPSTSESFIDSHTTIESGDNAIDQIIIENSIDPTTYQPDYEIPNCEVSSITYEEKLTQCAPQKIKERVIRFLSEYGLSVEGRQYDIRDFWIVNRYGEPKLTFRRHESSQLGCSFMIRVSKTHYHAYLTCIHCSFNASLPTIGHPGENCPTQLPGLDTKYENLCSDSKSEYDNIEDDQSVIECKNETSSGTDSEGILTETTESDGGTPGFSKEDEMKKYDNVTSSTSDDSQGEKGGQPATLLPGQSQPATLLPGQSQPGTLLPGQSQPGTLLPGHSQSVITSSCKTTIVERNRTFIEGSPASSSQVIITTSQTSEKSKIFSMPETQSETRDTTETISKMKVFDKTESISTTLIEEELAEVPSKGIDLTTEMSDTSIISEKEISVAQEATTSVYRSTASISTFAIADLKTVSSTIEPKETTGEKQLENTSITKPSLDKSTLPIPTIESSTTRSTMVNNFTPVVSTLAPLTITELGISPSTSWIISNFSSITGSTLLPTTESLMPLSISSSSGAVLEDSATTCKTSYIPSKKKYKTQSYTHISSASSISAVTQSSLNTVILSSTVELSSVPTNMTSLLITTTMKPESISMVLTSENLVPIEIETSTQEMKTSKKLDLTTRKFMTRKKPVLTSTEIYSTLTAAPMTVESTTQLIDKSISSELTELKPSTAGDMKTIFTAPIPIITSIENGKVSTNIPISTISSASTKDETKSTNMSNVSIDETTEAGELPTLPATSYSSKDSKDYLTIISTQTTTCRSTTIGIKSSSTCKTTIPGSKSVSKSSIPSSSFPMQLPNQMISTSTTTYKTTIPTAKSSFISTKESTPILSLSITTGIIPASIGPVITTEQTAMTTLPNTKFVSYSPGLNITSSISPETTTVSSKMTLETKNLISPTAYSTSTVIYPTSTTYKTTLVDIPQVSTGAISLEAAPTSALQTTTTCKKTDSSHEFVGTTCKTTIHVRASSITPEPIAPAVTSHTREAEDIFSTTISSQSALLKSTYHEDVYQAPPSFISSTTTCRTTTLFVNTIPSSTTCRTTTTFSPTTTCRTTTISSPTTTCRTTTTSSPTTTCKITTTSSPTTTCRITTLFSPITTCKITTTLNPTTTCRTTTISNPTTTCRTTTISSPTTTCRTTTMSSPTTTCRTTVITSPTTTCRSTTITSPTTTCRITTITSPTTTCKTTTMSSPTTTCRTTTVSSPTTTCKTTTKSSPTTTCRTTTITSPTTTCKTTTISSPTTTCRITTISSPTTTCRTTTVSSPTTTCRTTTTSSQITTCKTTIPLSKSVEEKTSVITEDFIDQIHIDVTTPIIITDKISSTDKISTLSSSDSYLTSLITTTQESIIDIIKSTTEQWSQWTNVPTVTTCRTTLMKSAIPTISSSTCKTTIQQRQSISMKMSSTTMASLLSKSTDITPESTVSITQSSDFQQPVFLSLTSTSATMPQTQISTSSSSIIPISTTCKITTLLESTPITSLSATTCKTTLPTIKSTIPQTTTCKSISITDPSYTLPSITTGRTTCAISTTSLLTVKSTTICPITLLSTEIISTNPILPSTTMIPSTITRRITGISDTYSPLMSTPQITTTCKTTSRSAYVSTSTCKTTFIDSKIVIPTANTQCKTDCSTDVIVTSTEEESEILPGEGIISTTTSSESTLLPTKLQTAAPTTTTCRTTTIMPSTTTCKTTTPLRDTTISTCKTISVTKTTYPLPTAITETSTTVCPPIKSISSAESTPTISLTTFASTEKAYSELIGSSNFMIVSTTQKPEELSDLLPAGTISLIETTTCKTTHSSSSSTEIFSCKTTIHQRKLPTSSSEPIIELNTQQSSSPSQSASESLLTSLLTKADIQSTLTSHTTLYSTKPASNSLPTSIASLQSTIQIPSYSATTFLASTVFKSSTETTIFIPTSSPLTISSLPDYETNVSLIPQEDSTILEQLSTKTSPSFQDQINDRLTISSNAYKTTNLETVTTSTCKTTITNHSFMKESKIETTLSSSTSTIKESITTTCKTTESTTCKTLLSSLLPITTTCRTTILTSKLADTTLCKTTLSTPLPTLIQTTTCKTTISSTSPTTSTCKTTIPTEFPTIEPTIITLLPFGNSTISSFAAPISAASMSISSSTSSASISEEPKNYTCKTTMISRSENSTSSLLKTTMPNIHINTEKESIEISTFINTSNIFESSTSKIEQIPTSTSISLTEGLSSRLGTFISSLLPSDWRSSQNQPTSTYSTNKEQTDITSIFLSSLEPNKDINDTLDSFSFNCTTTPRCNFTTDIIEQKSTPALITATASTYITDMHGYIISSNIPPTESSKTMIQAISGSSTLRTTFRSHRGSTLAPTSLFPETTTIGAISTIYPTLPCRSTAVNGTGATCIITTTFDLTNYMPNNSSTESSKDMSDSRNTTAPFSKSKPCLCINWYLICLIFTIAFIFAWCLLCWQKMLL